MLIRRALMRDLPDLAAIYSRAREYMVQNGNPDQWWGGYPTREMLEDDICLRRSYVGIGVDRRAHFAFALIFGADETYEKIEGRWLNERPYATLHRVASDGTLHGVFAECVAYARLRCDNLRVDTHEKNTAMLRAIEKCGFRRCGIIHVADGTPRIAFQIDFSSKSNMYEK